LTIFFFLGAIMALFENRNDNFGLVLLVALQICLWEKLYITLVYLLLGKTKKNKFFFLVKWIFVDHAFQWKTELQNIKQCAKNNF